MNYPALLSFSCGFISLSLEILWVRLYGFSMLSTPIAFGFVLMAYLAGIAIGAWKGGGICKNQPTNSVLWGHSIMALLISTFTTLVLPAFFVEIQNQWWKNPIIDFLLIAIASGLLAYIFPIAHHLGAGPGTTHQGQRFAWVYTSNVMGAALGPLITGYILLNFFTLQQGFLILALLQLVVIVWFVWTQCDELKKYIIYTRMQLPLFGSIFSIAGVIFFLFFNVEPHALIQKINSGGYYATQVIENKHGIITIIPANAEKNKHYEKGDDAVYGGNVYDGRTNISLEKNTNGLHRPLLLAALQRQPKRVLMVGLSIGSWLALVNGFPQVEHIDVIEINSGYLQAAQTYPIQAQALKDPRVNIVIDDARRWLRLHPKNTYDIIVMNTTWHWRANSSFLLSRDFLQLIRKHMAQGAVMAFNATGSPDAFYTAAHVFDYAYRYDNFIYAADFDFKSRKDDLEAKKIYANIKIEEIPVFIKNDELIKNLLKMPFISLEQEQKLLNRPLEIITDANSLTEFKYGYSLSHLY